MRELSVQKLATLVLGLRDNSRVKLKLSGMKADLQTLLLASAVDQLKLLVWTKTKDAQNGRNHPQSIAHSLMAAKEKQEADIVACDTVEEFEKLRNQLLGG